MKKNGKKWRQLQKEKEARRANLDIPVTPKEPQECVCTHCYGIPFHHYPKIEKWSPIPIPSETPIFYPKFDFLLRKENWFDGSFLSSMIIKSSTYEGHCDECKTKFCLDEIEKLDTLIEYLKRPDWNGKEADRLSVGIEPVRYLKDGKKITHIEKLSNYYREYYEKNPPDATIEGTREEYRKPDGELDWVEILKDSIEVD